MAVLGAGMPITPPQFSTSITGRRCDAITIAVRVGGEESAQWFGQPELAGYQLFAVNRGEESTWEI